MVVVVATLCVSCVQKAVGASGGEGAFDDVGVRCARAQYWFAREPPGLCTNLEVRLKPEGKHSGEGGMEGWRLAWRADWGREGEQQDGRPVR